MSPFAFFSSSGAGNSDIDVIARPSEHFPREQISEHW